MYKKERLEEQIRRLVSELLIKDIKDPRIGFVTITGVEMSKDYSLARVGISILGTAREMRMSLEGLESARGYIQHRVGKSLKVRVIPRIEFYPDGSVAEGVDMVDLIDSVAPEDRDDEDGDENRQSLE